MQEINYKVIFEEYKKVQEKLKSIAALPYSMVEKEFVSITIEDDYFIYNTETNYSGDVPDTHALYVSGEDIDKPLEFFADKFKKEHDALMEKLEKRREQERQRDENADRQTYERLKARFEGK